MSREVEDESTLPGQDSFIDVVCNMVGILIILVMVVGARMSHVAVAHLEGDADGGQPSAATEAELAGRSLEELKKQLADAVRKADALRGEAEDEANRAVEARRQTLLVDAQREAQALVRAAAEKEIAERRAKLDGADRENFDLQRRIQAAQIELGELDTLRVSLVSAPTEVEEIECVPTPLARTVTGGEIHVRLKHGQLAVVPADELLAELMARASHLRSGLNARNEAEDVFGPINGFRVRFSVERVEDSQPIANLPGAPRRSMLVQQAVFLPNSDDIGQPVEQALLPGSSFMQAIRSRRSAVEAVTAWVYPDSYAGLRTLKKALWELNMPLAIRPLPDGQPIIFSSLGTRSTAE